MSTTELPQSAGHENADPPAEDRDLLGDSSIDGAENDDQEGSGEDETSSENQSAAPDNPTSEDEDAKAERAFIQRLASGTLDDTDENGEPIEAKPAETEDETAEPEAKAEEESKPKEEERPPVDADKDLTDEEKAEVEKASRGQRKGLKKLFHERRTLREEVAKTKKDYEAIAPAKKFADDLIQHASEAGLVVRGEGGKTDFSGLRDIIEEQRSFIGKKPSEIAAHYRKLADSIDPDSKPVKLTPDLQELVDAERLTAEEAEIVQRKKEARLAAEAEAKDPERRLAKLEADRARAREAQAAEQTKVEKAAAYADVGKLATEYKGRLSALDFTAIAEEVNTKLQAKIVKAPPALWRDMAENEFELAIARRRSSVKKVTKTPPPSSPSSRNSADDVMTEEEEREALASGRGL